MPSTLVSTPAKRVHNFCKKLGLKVDWHAKQRDYTWDGKVLRPSGSDLSMQLHDVAHWMLSPKRYRHLPEWGLGPDPYNDYFKLKYPVKYSSDGLTHMEELACTLQAALCFGFELPVKNIFETIEELFYDPTQQFKVTDFHALAKRKLVPRHWLTKTQRILAAAHLLDSVSKACK